MQKYKVEIKEEFSQIVEIEASSEEEAIDKVQKKFYNQEIVLEVDSYEGTDFKIYEDVKEQEL